jgi:MGT family glycosyltransferase
MLDFPRPARQRRLYIESVDEERVEASGFPWERLNPRQRLIYCSLGTQAFRYRQGPALLRAAMDAVAGNPSWQLVLTTGAHPRARELGPAPRNVVVVEHAPQLQLLRRAHVAMTHGGIGSAKEALLYGVPMLAAPQAYDQPGLSARLVFHGIGRMVGHRDVTPARIRALLEELDSSTEIRERVQRLSARFQEVERARPGLQEVERMLAGGKHQRPPQKPDSRRQGSGLRQHEEIDPHARPELSLGVDPVINVVRPT